MLTDYLPRVPRLSHCCSLYYFLCAALLAISISEIITSIVVYQVTGGFFIGAIYSGAACALVATFGLSTLIKWRHSMTFFLIFVLLDAISFIIAIIGTALTSQTLLALQSISSCAYYKPQATSCLTGVTNLACVGDSSSFYDSSNCASSTFSSPGNYYQNEIATPSDKCWCVFDTAVGQCVTFSGVPSCPDMLNYYPNLVNATFNFSWPLIILTAMLLCFRNPEALDIVDERFGHRQLRLPVGEVMVLAEGSERPRDVVATVAEWKPPSRIINVINSDDLNRIQQAEILTSPSEGKSVAENEFEMKMMESSPTTHNPSANRLSNNVNMSLSTSSSNVNEQGSQNWWGSSLFTSLIFPNRTTPQQQQRPNQRSEGQGERNGPMLVTDVVIVDEEVLEDLEQQRRGRS